MLVEYDGFVRDLVLACWNPHSPDTRSLLMMMMFGCKARSFGMVELSLLLARQRGCWSFRWLPFSLENIWHTWPGVIWLYIWLLAQSEQLTGTTTDHWRLEPLCLLWSVFGGRNEGGLVYLQCVNVALIKITRCLWHCLCVCAAAAMSCPACTHIKKPFLSWAPTEHAPSLCLRLGSLCGKRNNTKEREK